VIGLPGRDAFGEGFYRVKELADKGIIVIPENNVTAEVAKRLGLPDTDVHVAERKIGKKELAEIFSKAEAKCAASGRT
jgi:hypothetical protein